MKELLQRSWQKGLQIKEEISLPKWGDRSCCAGWKISGVY